MKLLVWCVIWSLYNSLGYTSSYIQYSSGTVIKEEHVINTGRVKVSMLVKIPAIPAIYTPTYPKPCNLVQQFSMDLLIANITERATFVNEFIQMCKNYGRLKRLNLEIRKYYNAKISRAKDSIVLLTRNRQKRSVFSFIRHALNIGDYTTQQKMRAQIATLENDQFTLSGAMQDMQFQIIHQSRRLSLLDNAINQIHTMVDSIQLYLNENVDRNNAKEIMDKYKQVFLHETIHSGMITNQFLSMLNDELEMREQSLALLSRHYLPVELVKPVDLQGLLRKFEDMLSVEHPSLQLVHKTIYDYYSVKNVHSVILNETFYVRIPLLLNFENQDFTVFSINAFYLPLPANDAAMKIQHNPLIAINKQSRTYFLPTVSDLQNCAGNKKLICNDLIHLEEHLDTSKSCEVAIINNNTNHIKDYCDIGLKKLENISPEILSVSTNEVIIINPAKDKLYEQCDNGKSRMFVSDQFLVHTTIGCFCWITSDTLTTATFVYEKCINTSVSTTFNPMENFLCISLLLNDTNFREFNSTIIQKLHLPETSMEYDLKDDSDLINLKKIMAVSERGLARTIHSRVSTNESALQNISIFKVFAMIVPVVLIVVAILTIMFMIKTKKIGQMVALSSIVKGSNAMPIGNREGYAYMDLITDVLMLLIVVLVVIYWTIKNYRQIIRFKNVISLPFSECVSTKRVKSLKIVLYIANLKDYCYLYVDELPFCLPHEILIRGKRQDFNITLHSGCVSSYVTLSNKLKISLRANADQTYDLPQAVAISMIQSYTVKTILSGNYVSKLLVGSENIYNEHEIKEAQCEASSATSS